MAISKHNLLFQVCARDGRLDWFKYLEVLEPFDSDKNYYYDAFLKAAKSNQLELVQHILPSIEKYTFFPVRMRQALVEAMQNQCYETVSWLMDKMGPSLYELKKSQTPFLNLVAQIDDTRMVHQVFSHARDTISEDVERSRHFNEAFLAAFQNNCRSAFIVREYVLENIGEIYEALRDRLFDNAQPTPPNQPQPVPAS